MITARWVLTWKRINENNPEEPPRYKAKARLVLRGFEDPDLLLSIKTAAPTTSRLARLFLLTITNWNPWELLCGDVKAVGLLVIHVDDPHHRRFQQQALHGGNWTPQERLQLRQVGKTDQRPAVEILWRSDLSDEVWRRGFLCRVHEVVPRHGEQRKKARR